MYFIAINKANTIKQRTFPSNFYFLENLFQTVRVHGTWSWILMVSHGTITIWVKMVPQEDERALYLAGGALRILIQKLQ